MNVFDAFWGYLIQGFLTACIFISCNGSLHLKFASLSRYPRSDVPEISMKSDAHWLTVSCIVRVPRARLKVFITCPALEHDSMTCYENCVPSRPCQSDSTANEKCVPNLSAVNCSESIRGNESKVTTLRIDKRDKRVAGKWVCSHAGQNSNSVNVELEVEAENPPIEKSTEPPPDKDEVTVPPPVEIKLTTPSSSNAVVPLSEGPPVYFAFTSVLSKSPWVFCIIAIFIVSLTVNLILWIRWCMLCVFAEKRKSQYNQQRTLGDMLCLPTGMKTGSSGLWENDVFPSSPNGDRFQSPMCLNDGEQNFRPFNTFTQAYLLDAPIDGTQQRYRHFDEADFAFPQIDHIRPEQLGLLYRARSATHTLSPQPLQNVRDWATTRSTRIRMPNGNVHTVEPINQLLSDSLISAPPQYNINSTAPSPKIDFTTLGPLDAIDSVSQDRLPRATPNFTSGVTPYDDVATNSTITVISRPTNAINDHLATQPHSIHTQQLPRMTDLTQHVDENELGNGNRIQTPGNFSYAEQNRYQLTNNATAIQQLQQPHQQQRTRLIDNPDAPVYHTVESFAQRQKTEA